MNYINHINYVDYTLCIIEYVCSDRHPTKKWVAIQMTRGMSFFCRFLVGWLIKLTTMFLFESRGGNDVQKKIVFEFLCKFGEKGV